MSHFSTDIFDKLIECFENPEHGETEFGGILKPFIKKKQEEHTAKMKKLEIYHENDKNELINMQTKEIEQIHNMYKKLLVIYVQSLNTTFQANIYVPITPTDIEYNINNALHEIVDTVKQDKSFSVENRNELQLTYDYVENNVKKADEDIVDF
jgi:hypothetical protein